MKTSFLSLLLVLLCAGGAFAQPAAPTVTGDTIICAGSTTTLLANGQSGATFKWYNVATGGSQISNGALYTTQNLNTPGTYHFYVEQFVSPFISARKDVVITVVQKPTISVTASRPVTCKGVADTLTATGATSYTWSPGGATGASLVVMPLQTTTYTVTGSVPGCQANPVTVTVIVDSLVAPPAVNICPGISTTLTASGTATYSWMPGNLIGSSITVAPTSTTTYTVTSTGTSCPSSKQVTVTVYTGITGLTASGPSSITAGTLVPLTATAVQTGLMYEWSPYQGVANPLSDSTITLVPTTTTSYTVTARDSNNCTATAFKTVTVLPVPEVAGVTTVCANSGTTLTASGTGPFTWYDAETGGSVLYTGASFVTPNLTSNTSYWVSGNGGPRKLVSLFVPTTTLSGVAAVPATVCTGRPTYLRAAYGTGIVKWYDAPTGGTLIGSTLPGDSLAATPTGNTTYYAEATPVALTASFEYTGAVQTWTVPAGVTSIRVDAYGASGRNPNRSDGWSGAGGQVQTTLAVTPGQLLSIYVGGKDSWNGGGFTQSPSGFPGIFSRGGDATDIRIGGTALVNRVLVAGGGGAASHTASVPQGSYTGLTGNGGGLTGQQGGKNTSAQVYAVSGTGGGGQSGGGPGGCFSPGASGVCGRAGSFGYGGNAFTYYTDYAGGSGGGGWYGGGGGANYAGGGGGSSYTNPQLCQNTVHTQGAWIGLGSVTISWGISCTASARVPATVTVTPGAVFTTDLAEKQLACQDGALSLSAPVTGATSYQWYKAGVVIPGATNSSYSVPSITTADSGRYSMVAFGPQGCNDTTSSQIFTGPKASVSFLGDTAVCAGGVALLPKLAITGGMVPYIYSYTVDGGAVQTVTDSGLRVRYIRVKQNNTNANLNLAEIQAIEAITGNNVALNKPAIATSTLSSYPLPNINDGILTNLWHNNSGSDTEYVEIDLGAPGYLLSSVKITNRQDCCQDRSSNLQLILGNSSGSTVRSRQVNVYQGQNTNYTYVFSDSLSFAAGYAFAPMPGNTPAIRQYNVLSITSEGQGCNSTLPVNRTYTVKPSALITAEPVASTSVCAGVPLSLSVTANNASGYQWLKNGTAISGAASASYSVVSTATSASGIYRVVAYGAGSCNDTSTTATVSVGAPATAAITAGNLCVGMPNGAVTFTGSGGSGVYTYSYSYNNGAAQTITGGGSVATRYVRVQQNVADWFHLSEIRAIQAGTGVNVAAGKTVTSSAMNSGYGAALATDGDATTYFHTTGNTSDSYVEIDLGASYEISQIQMVNRPNCCWDRAANLQLILKDAASTVVSSRQVNAWQNQNSNYQTSFPASPLAIPTFPVNTAAPGSYIYNLLSVTSMGCTVPLNIIGDATVHTPADIVLGMPATQSLCAESPLTLGITATNAIGYQWLRSGTVIAGATSNIYGTPSATFSDNGIYKAIAIGGGGCNDTATAQVTVNSATATIAGTTTLCTGSSPTNIVITPTGGFAPYTYTYNINGGTNQTVTTAANSVRYIRIKQNSSLNLHLAEVTATVPGSSTNIALNKPVTVLSTLAGFVGSNLTNGNTSDFYHSNAANNSQYAEIDLGQEYNINQITIRNRTDCCQNHSQNLQLILKNGAGTQVSSQAINAYQGQNSGLVTTYSFPGIYNTTIVAPNNTAGTYQYNLVSMSSANGCTSTLPTNAVVTVGNPAVITTELPATATACLSTPFVQTIIASNAVSYQWRKNGVNIAGATGASYAITSPALSDSGIYTVIAYGTDCNDTSANAFVGVKPAPSASLTTSADSFCMGGALPVVQLSAVGIGASATYTYSYTVNGGAVQTVTDTGFRARYVRVTQNAADWMNLSEIALIQNGTGINLAPGKTVTSSGANSGEPATNINDGNLTNLFHTNTMNAGNWIEIDLGAMYALSQIRITNRQDCCQSRASNLQLTLKDSAGTLLSSKQIDAYQNQNTNYTSTFSFPVLSTITVPTSTAGRFLYAFTSISSNGCTNNLTNVSKTITVNPKAAITTHPADSTVLCEGSPLQLSAMATGATSYQWIKGGIALSGATATTFSKGQVSISDTGRYRLVAMNTAGCNDTSKQSYTKINKIPSIAVAGSNMFCKDAAVEGLQLGVSNGSTEAYSIVYSVNGNAPVTKTNAAQARYIRIMQNSNTVYYIAEIRAIEEGSGTNVALNKPVTASSNPGASYTLVDGITSLYNAWGAAAPYTGAWAEIDLGATYMLSRIEIVNSGACCQNGLANQQLILKGVSGAQNYSKQINAYQNQNTGYTSQFPLLSSSIMLPVPTAATGTANYTVTSITNGSCTSNLPNTNFSATINQSALITTEPVPASICTGSPFTLPTVATNAISYQWTKGNTAVSGQTGATFTKAISSAADSGTYKLIAMGVAGCNDTSAAVAVKMQPLPTATITGNNLLCEGVASAVVLTGATAPKPYTFSYSINAGAVQTGTTDFTKVRYVRVKQNAADFINLAEIQAIEPGAGTNVALGKTVTASSASTGAPASNINDGNTISGDAWISAVSNAGEWVEIDLGAPGYVLSSIKITNSSFCCQNRSANLQLILKDTAGNLISSEQINAYGGQNSGFTTTFPINANGSTVTLPVATAVPGDFSYKLLSVTSANGCVSTVADSGTVTVVKSAHLTTQPVSSLNVCMPNPLVLSTAGTDVGYYRWQRNGVNIVGSYGQNYLKTNAIPANIAGTYRVIAIHPEGCNDTSTNSVVTTGMLTPSIPGTTAVDSQVHTDGLDYVYTTGSCEPIAEVAEANGGNVLGSMSARVMMDSSVQTFNLSPYLQRHYDIQPTNNGPATVKLYATQAEFDAYNAYITANGLNISKLPVDPTDAAGIANIAVTQFHGLPSAGTTGPGGQYDAAHKEAIPNSAIATTWNGSYWTMSFPVSGFSGFFINSSGNGVPLPLRLTAVSARNLGSTNEVLWNTATEDPGTVFEVERSLDASQFSKIGTVPGTGKDNTDYRLVDERPATGINYYRIRAITAGGESQVSKVVMASVKAGVFVVEAFPNPTRDFVTVRLSGMPGPDAKVTVSDISGKVLLQLPVKSAVLELPLKELAGGLYFLRYQDGSHSQVLKITKE